MCDALGSEPIESEIPKDLADFPLDVILAYHIYSRLDDKFDGMAGAYLGKNLSNIQLIMDLININKEDRLFLFDIINIINECETEQINKKIKNSVQPNKAK